MRGRWHPEMLVNKQPNISTISPYVIVLKIDHDRKVVAPTDNLGIPRKFRKL